MDTNSPTPIPLCDDEFSSTITPNVSYLPTSKQLYDELQDILTFPTSLPYIPVEVIAVEEVVLGQALI